MTFLKEKERFYQVDENGQLIAEITWKEEDDIIYANHTYTHGSLRGQGIAAQLVDTLVEYSQSVNKKIYPVCSYVLKQFDENDKYQAVDARSE